MLDKLRKKTEFDIKPEKVFLLGPLQDNYLLNVLLNMFLDFNLWPFFFTYRFSGKKFIRYALFNEDTDEKIIEDCEKNLEKVNHTKFNYIHLNKNIIENIKPYIILGKKDKLIPPKLGIKALELYNFNGIIKMFNIGHNMMMDNGWENICNYILNNI